MNWWIVVGRAKGLTPRAVLCEERALGWVREDLEGTYTEVERLPVECHWTAEVRFPTHPHDVDGIERW